jgi:Lrp/AsnC family transcriptional regulator for asnA, asnC and gidA
LKAVDRLDQIDVQIIRLLNEDGRMSNSEIARRLGGIPARTVGHRVESLIERKIITVRAVVNPETIGYSVLADVFIETEPGRLREVAEKVAEFPQVSYVAGATGDTDVIISVRARNIEELYNFVIEVLGKIPGVRQTQTFLLPLKIKNIATWLPPHVLEVGEENSD